MLFIRSTIVGQKNPNICKWKQLGSPEKNIINTVPPRQKIQRISRAV